MWTCPHCGAPQAETARCWVCHRSSTTCSTCRNFRASLATDVNYCALDRRRRPLTGLELRGCWEERPSSLQATARLAGLPGTPARGGTVGAAIPDGATTRGFIPVEDVIARRQAAPVEPPEAEPQADVDLPFVMIEPVEGWEGRTSLFGEPER
jgi:hypothetical protein